MSPTIYHIAISFLTYVEHWVPTSPMDFSVGQMKSLDQSGLPRQAQPVKQAKTSSNGHGGGQCLAQPRLQRSAQPWPRQSILGSWSQADNCCRQQRVEGIGSHEII